MAIIGLFAAVLWQLREPPLNVILITLDTTRADRLGIYGYQNGETSSFDRYAAQGVIFEHAYAPAPITLPSHATILTGLYPPEHGLRVNGQGRLPSEIPLLSELLKNKGYQTAAFVSSSVLDATFGLNRGFDLYDDYASQKNRKQLQRRHRNGRNVVDAALSWLNNQASQRFFCWIHLYDAHAPYTAREEIFGDRFKQTPYDAGIAYELQQVDRVTTFLKEHHLDQKTLVVITADHGEGLGDHRESEHGMLAYNSTLHVPLVFVGTKRCQPARRVSTAVSVADITPTILDVLNLRAPNHVSGRSLKDALGGHEIPAKYSYAEAESPFLLNHLCPLRVIVSDRWKYIHTTRPELYDLLDDPSEQANLWNSAVEQQTELENILELIQQSFVSVKPQKLQLSTRQLSDLNALGYTGINRTSTDAEIEKSAILKDVKDVLPALEKYEQAKRLILEGNTDAVIALTREIERMVGPGEFLEAGFMLGDCLALTDHADEAIEVFLTLLEKHPDVQNTRLRLAAALAKQGKFEESAEEYRKILKLDPESALAHHELAKKLVKLQQFNDAIAEFREAIRLAPTVAQSYLELGNLYLKLKQPREAATCYEKTLENEPDNAVAQASLLSVLVHLGESAKASEYARKAIELDPMSFEAHFNLGLLLISQNRTQEGIAEFRAAQLLRPDDPRPVKLIQQAEAAMTTREVPTGQ
jgi:arylsulfatase A-like enzyme/Tfp pilus assembly protein PilF